VQVTVRHGPSLRVKFRSDSSACDLRAALPWQDLRSHIPALWLALLDQPRRVSNPTPGVEGALCAERGDDQRARRSVNRPFVGYPSGGISSTGSSCNWRTRVWGQNPWLQDSCCLACADRCGTACVTVHLGGRNQQDSVSSGCVVRNGILHRDVSV
jgi:hypothetical protein